MRIIQKAKQQHELPFLSRPQIPKYAEKLLKAAKIGWRLRGRGLEEHREK